MTPLIALMVVLACPFSESGLPAFLADWSAPRQAANTLAFVGSSRLTLTADARMAVTPGKPPAPSTFGGVTVFTVDIAGIYEVALSEAVWIDVAKDGAALTSITHRHGPKCTSIRKIVAFDLKPGIHTLQISGSAKPAATVAIYRAGL